MQCVQNMPRHQVPAQFVLLDTLPLTVNGKLDRRKAPIAPPLKTRGVLSAADGGMNEGYLRTKMEQVIAATWEMALNIQGIGPLDNFWFAACPFYVPLSIDATGENCFVFFGAVGV